MLLWNIVAKNQEFRQRRLQSWHDSFPLTITIRPQNTGGSNLYFRVKDSGATNRLQKMIKHAHTNYVL